MAVCVENLKIESPLDVLVLFLSQGEIGGITRIGKLMYLVGKSQILDDLPKYEFEFGNFGPYSIRLFDDLQALKIIKAAIVTRSIKTKNHLDTVDEESVESDIMEVSWQDYPVETYVLSQRAQSIGNVYKRELTDKQALELRRIFNLKRLPMSNLLHYVYSTYLPPLQIGDPPKKPKRKWWHFWSD